MVWTLYSSNNACRKWGGIGAPHRHDAPSLPSTQLVLQALQAIYNSVTGSLSSARRVPSPSPRPAIAIATHLFLYPSFSSADRSPLPRTRHILVSTDTSDPCLQSMDLFKLLLVSAWGFGWMIFLFQGGSWKLNFLWSHVRVGELVIPNSTDLSPSALNISELLKTHQYYMWIY